MSKAKELIDRMLEAKDLWSAISSDLLSQTNLTPAQIKQVGRILIKHKLIDSSNAKYF